MTPLPPFADVPRATPPPPPPSFPPTGFSPPALPGDKPGLCGLTGDQWHMVMIFGIPLLIALFIVLIISWLNSYDICSMWLRAQERAKMARMGLRERLFGHLLSENDIRSGLIVTGPSITPWRYPTVNFILSQLRALSPTAT